MLIRVGSGFFGIPLEVQAHGSDCIGEGALDFAEDHEAEKEETQTDPEADGPLDQIHPAYAKKGQAEGLDNGDHGIPDEHVLPFLGHGRERIEHATGIHPKLDAEANQDGQVFITRGHGTDDAPHPDSQQRHLHQENG